MYPRPQNSGDTKSRLVSLTAAIVWLENGKESSIFALEFCGGFVAVGTFWAEIFDLVRQAVRTDVFCLALSS